jgi:chromosomal replication initiator protein
MFDSGNIAVQTEGQNAAESITAVFEQIKATLRRECGDTNFRSWIQPLSFGSFTGDVLAVSVPTRFVRDWVKTHYTDRIQKLWAQQFGKCSRVEFSIADKISVTTAAPPEVLASVSVANENRDIAGKADELSSPLDPRFTFANFITGPSNEMALAAARRVADTDNAPFNPLFLQGGVGMGKTHLMQAAAHALRARKPQSNIVYMSAEKFMFHFVRALRARDTMSFKEAFRAIDVLMIDDIQFICGKETTQQEFIHTLNALIDQGKQVILCADRTPAEMQDIDERLRSRLGMGLVATIQPASYELRLAVLRSKCALTGREMTEDVLSFLAEKITSNLRELEGALNRLIAHAELMSRPVTLETAETLLLDLLRSSARRLSIEEIQQKVAEHYNIRVSDILSPRRARPLARPRQVAMYLTKALTEHSLPEIGRKFGGRDHTTIIHGVRKIEELMTADATMRDDVEKLRRAITN